MILGPDEAQVEQIRLAGPGDAAGVRRALLAARVAPGIGEVHLALAPNTPMARVVALLRALGAAGTRRIHVAGETRWRDLAHRLVTMPEGPFELVVD